MSDISIPRFRRSRIGLLTAVTAIGFVIIISGVAFSSVQSGNILTVTNQLTNLRQSAARFNALSKDLLITNNMLQTFDAWKAARREVELGIEQILENPSVKRGLAGQEGELQDRNTRRMMELITPKMDHIQELIEFVMQQNSSYIPGLYDLKATGVSGLDSTITEVRNFSLYIGDLLNVRMDALSAFIAESGLYTIRITSYVLFAISVAILGIILMVLRALGRAQRRNEETTNYLEGVLKAIYEISGQGFLTFDQTLHVDSAISRQSARLIGRDPGGLDVAELLWERKVDQNDFRDGMDLIFQGKAKAEVVFDLFEKELRMRDKYLRINFSSLPNGRIMLALTDVSREHALKELMEAEENRRTIILKAVSRRQYFAGFVRDARQLFVEMGRLELRSPSDGDLEALMRHVHSFKGNAAFFSFKETARAAHDFEYHISDSRVLGDQVDIKANFEIIQGAYSSELSHITDSLGHAWLDTLDSVSIPLRTYLKLERYIRSRYAKDTILVAHVASHRRQPLRDLFARYPEMVSNLAQQLGKLVNPVEIKGGDFPVLPERFEALLSVLVHLVRNMVDHGIEYSSERERQGKTPEGNIRIELAKESQAWMISLGDDGKGIDLAALESRARSQGLLQPEDQPDESALLELLFAPGLSTAAETTEVSGRGIGMSAVREAVLAAGGTMSIQTRPNRGTEYDIIIPFRKEPS